MLVQGFGGETVLWINPKGTGAITDTVVPAGLMEV